MTSVGIGNMLVLVTAGMLLIGVGWFVGHVRRKERKEKDDREDRG